MASDQFYHGIALLEGAKAMGRGLHAADLQAAEGVYHVGAFFVRREGAKLAYVNAEVVGCIETIALEAYEAGQRALWGL